jgi:uncharacterized membrane protein (UPF0127 family)
MKKISLILLAFVLFSFPVQAQESSTQESSVYVTPLDTAVIRTQLGDVHKFNIERAITQKALKKGLMNRQVLAKDTGMLFLFERDRMAVMWMKDTLIPLDMLFINHKGKIAMIYRNAEPMSEKLIYGAQPVRAVLEINAGLSKELGIKVGDTLDYPLLK